MKLFKRKKRSPNMETERLYLRAWKPKDAEDFFAYAKDPRVGPAAGWPPHTNIWDSLMAILHYRHEPYIWALEQKASGKVIGCVGLYHDNGRPDPQSVHRELGFSLSPEYWGQRYMREACHRVMDYAFRELKLDEMTIYHFCDNEKSQRLTEKLGFRFRYVIHNALRTWDGILHDCKAYHMRREDYDALMLVHEKTQEFDTGI